GEIDPEQLQRELDQLRQNLGLLESDLKDLEQIAADLAKTAEMMRQGKEGEAAAKLDKAGQKKKGLDREGEKKQQDLGLRKVQEGKEALGAGLGKQPAPGGGRRPERKKEPFKTQESRGKGQRAPGQIPGIGSVPGPGLKGPRKPADPGTLIREAGREAAEAL